ncbi:MAG: type II toxin-antitoxin system RelE/ParE family toxin [Planctomycetaceae bacterium]
MRFDVRLTPEAEAQLDRAMAWYFERDPDIAAEWYRGFRQAIIALAENPHRCSKSPENDQFEDELRDLLTAAGAGRPIGRFSESSGIASK